MYSAVFNSSSILYSRFCLSVVFALFSPNTYFKKNSKGEIVSVFFSQPHDGMLPGKFLFKDFNNISKVVDFFLQVVRNVWAHYFRVENWCLSCKLAHCLQSQVTEINKWQGDFLPL